MNDHDDIPCKANNLCRSKNHLLYNNNDIKESE